MPTTTNYIWDDENYLAESDATNTINVVYTNEPRPYGNLVSSRISGTTSYHHFDALGSTRQLTNAVASVTDTVIYDAWGNTVDRAGSTAVRLLWIARFGYYSDPETGLLSVRERAYGSIMGRWSSADSAAFVDGPNLYWYVLNTPATSVDPSGLQQANDD